MNYILKDKIPVVEPDLHKWCSWREQRDRGRIDKTMVGDVRISTVFPGIDHGYDGRVELFETMIFGGNHDQYCDRYATWTQSKKGHKRAVLLVKNI